MTKAKIISELEELKEFKDRNMVGGSHFKNLKEFPLVKRPFRGTSAMHFDLSGNQTIKAHVSEIPPLGSSRKHRHFNEAIIYIVCGKGYSIIQQEEEPEERYEWGEGDLFSPPHNSWHQHFNTDPEQPARYLAITNDPLMEKMGLFQKEQFPDKNDRGKGMES